MWLLEKLLMLLIMKMVIGQNLILEQTFAMEPQDQVAVVGARVILPCRVRNKHGVLQWTKDDFGLGTKRRLNGFDRYSMIGSDEEGDYSLQIYPVTLEDNAEFQCQVSPGGHDHPGIRSRYARLTILVEPDPPIIIQGEVLKTIEDREIELDCVSANGKPASEITWIDGYGNVLTTDIEYVKESSADMRRFTAKSTLKLKANKNHHNRTVTCQAQNSVEKTYRTARIRLEVKYAPKVVVSVTGGSYLNKHSIPEGNTVMLSCEAEANPNEIDYLWYINDEAMIGESTPHLVLENVTRINQNAIIKCIAKNSIGVSSDSEILDIIYPPTFRRKPQKVEADRNENITLRCEVDANPTPEIIWVFAPTDRLNCHPSVVGSTTQLNLIVTNETAGRYFCKANSIGYPEIKAETTVSINGPPKIVSAQEQYPMDVGDSFPIHEIECTAVSIPAPKHISWAFNGRLIDAEKDFGFLLRETLVPEGVRSTLQIVENRTQYYGRYTCVVINSYGTDTLDIIFMEPKNNLLYLVSIGTLAAVTAALIITSFCAILFWKKIKHKTLPPADIIPIEKDISKLNRSNKNAIKKSPTTTDDTDSPLSTVTIMAKPVDKEYPESNSGSYSTTTTLSINKTDQSGGKGFGFTIPIAPVVRYSEHFTTDSLGNNSNQSITDSTSYVNYARDLYSPTIQNANNCYIQQQKQHQQQQFYQHQIHDHHHQGEIPTYV